MGARIAVGSGQALQHGRGVHHRGQVQAAQVSAADELGDQAAAAAAGRADHHDLPRAAQRGGQAREILVPSGEGRRAAGRGHGHARLGEGRAQLGPVGGALGHRDRQHRGEEPPERGGQVRPPGPQRHDRPAEHRLPQRAAGHVPVGALAAEQLVEQGAQAVDVRGGPRGVALQHLRSGVAQRAAGLARPGVQRARRAQVEHRHAGRPQQHVARLDVQVQQPAAVQVLDHLDQPAEGGEPVLQGEVGQAAPQRLAVDPCHRESADRTRGVEPRDPVQAVDQADQAGVVQGGQPVGLGAEQGRRRAVRRRELEHARHAQQAVLGRDGDAAGPLGEGRQASVARTDGRHHRAPEPGGRRDCLQASDCQGRFPPGNL